jgi:hypothetical protein
MRLIEPIRDVSGLSCQAISSNKLSDLATFVNGKLRDMLKSRCKGPSLTGANFHLSACCSGFHGVMLTALFSRDLCAFHIVVEALQAVAVAGSSAFNVARSPIEQAFAKVKHWIRCAKNPPSRSPAPISALSSLHRPGECKNYLENDGYASGKHKTSEQEHL